MPKGPILCHAIRAIDPKLDVGSLLILDDVVFSTMRLPVLASQYAITHDIVCHKVYNIDTRLGMSL